MSIVRHDRLGRLAALGGLVAALMASCSTPVAQPARSAAEEQHLQQLLAGKAAGPPVNCVPTYNSGDMAVIDGRTISFRVSSRMTYIAHLSQGCSSLGNPGYALLTKSYGGSGLCRNDIAQVIDTSSQMIAGSCTIDEIVPYNRTP